jgi:cell division protein FtsA
MQMAGAAAGAHDRSDAKVNVSNKERIICGLDIGTTKVCMLIGRGLTEGRLEVVSTGYADSGGLRKGVVVDLDEAAASIRKAAEEAESKSGISVDWVSVGISGDHVQSYNCHGAVSIDGKHNEVTERDVQHVVQAAQSIPMSAGREVIHILPQEYLLDGRRVDQPKGLTGARLDVNIHVVTCDAALNQNLINAVNRAQMRVRKSILQQLASAEAVLTPDEKELGTAVVDIGGGTTDIALFASKSIRFTSVVPVGGAHFTRDLAVGLRTPVENAEQIKKESGTLILAGIADDEVVEVPGVGTRDTRQVSRRTACQILRDRGVELLELVRAQLDRGGERDQLVGGVVLTGGGSMLTGMLDLGQEILEMPVRQGLPIGIQGLADELCHPVYATAIGLALLGLQQNGEPKKPASASLLNRFMSWLG